MPETPRLTQVADRRLLQAAAAAQTAAQRLGASPGSLAYLHEFDSAVVELARLRDEAIGCWARENPDRSLRQIADALGRSKSDVHRLTSAPIAET